MRTRLACLTNKNVITTNILSIILTDPVLLRGSLAWPDHHLETVVRTRCKVARAGAAQESPSRPHQDISGQSIKLLRGPALKLEDLNTTKNILFEYLAFISRPKCPNNGILFHPSFHIFEVIQYKSSIYFSILHNNIHSWQIKVYHLAAWLLMIFLIFSNK